MGNLLALIPLRSSLTHAYGIKSINGGGIDFHKTIFIKPEEFSNSVKEEVLISNAEYNSLYKKEYLFKEKLIKCIEDYIKAESMSEAQRHQGLKNLLSYSTLSNYQEDLKDILSKLKKL